MARIKSSGDSGSPWRTPRACLNFFPGIPLSNTFEDEVASSVVIQSLHFWPKPNALITSRRKTQLKESNALEMSNFIKRAGRPDLCKALITLCT